MFPDDETAPDYEALTDRELLLAILLRMDQVVAIGKQVETSIEPLMKHPMLKMLGKFGA